MLLVDHTPTRPETNLALDEALLLDADRPSVLRFWEPAQPLVVVGRSSRIEEEVDVAACREDGTPILRRVSGGLAIVTGPGCLMYSVVIDTPGPIDLDQAHARVLTPIVDALRELDGSIRIAGTSDLAIARGSTLRKFSGNSVRVARERLLYHGTLLYNFDLGLISRCLRKPPRAPDYRAARPHDEFVACLNATRSELVERIAAAWDAEPGPLPDRVTDEAERLADTRYSDPAWTFAR